MFYNVENYFDTEDDYETEDDEFLPVGFYRWTPAKFEKKRDDIARIIDTIGIPTIVGLCEVENRFVLEQLTQQTNLSKYGYAILHRDSPDPRGIDVALLYLPQQLRLIDSAFFKVNITKRTREILYAKGILGNIDTLHIFVNHWSSKIEGEEETEPYRIKAARTLRQKIDSILQYNPTANIIAMGDFNDLPDSKSIQEGLRAKSTAHLLQHNDIYNLATLLESGEEGTSKYKGKWQLVDMMFCSATMLNNNSKLYCNPLGFTIFKDGYLLEADKTYGGIKPKRTLAGPRHIGGVSDHLPVYIDIKSSL
jgi:predicted extracellular nuclease